MLTLYKLLGRKHTIVLHTYDVYVYVAELYRVSTKNIAGCSSDTHPLAQHVESILGDADSIVVDGAVVAMH